MKIYICVDPEDSILFMTISEEMRDKLLEDAKKQGYTVNVQVWDTDETPAAKVELLITKGSNDNSKGVK